MNEFAGDTELQGEDECTLESLFPEGQIRLAEISVYHWGTFGENRVHTAAINADGTLITGHTGAGKTTFIDALQALFLAPNNTYFNVAAAQGDRRDRSLLTYLRGKYASEEDSNGRDIAKYKRPKAATSGIRALFKTDSGAEFTMIGIFWIGASGKGVGDINRRYLTARRNLQLRDVLDVFRGGSTGHQSPANLDNRYDEDRDVQIAATFEAHAVHFCDLLSIENKKAPSLLVRAMGLKRIDDLTHLVRTLVLEEPETRGKALDAIKEFEDLEQLHASCEEAQNRRDLLKGFPDHLKSTEELIRTRTSLKRLQKALPVWYGRQRLDLLFTLLAGLQSDRDQLESDKTEAENRISRAEEARDAAKLVYDAAGGDKLELHRKEVTRLEKQRDRTVREQEQALRLIKASGVANEEFVWSEESFRLVKADARKHLEESEAARQQAQDGYRNALIVLGNSEEALREVLAEVKSLSEKPDSMIDSTYQKLRASLCQKLEVTSEKMPFLGELIAVQSQELKWQGAIERVLGFQRLRLCVESDLGRALVALLNDLHMGRRVGVEFVDTSVGMTPFAPDSFLRKLDWKPHPFREWLKLYLSGYTLDCVASVEEMRERPFSMTQSGLVHRKKGSFDKDDSKRVDDPREWMLGFNNEAKKAALAKDAQSLYSKVQIEKQSAKAARVKQAAVENEFSACKQLTEVSWADVDISSALAELAREQKVVSDIENSGLDLVKAKQEYETRKLEEADARAILTKIQGSLTLVRQKIESYQKRQSTWEQVVSVDVSKDATEELQARFERLSEASFLEEIESGTSIIQGQAESALQSDIEAVQEKLSEVDLAAGKAMSAYRTRFKSYCHELPDRAPGSTVDQSVPVLAEWVRHYEQIVNEKLPDLLERFEHSLNSWSTKSMTVISKEIEKQAEEISDRIEDINHVLRGTEFRPGMYLEIAPVALRQEAVNQFNAQLAAATRIVAVGEARLQFEALKTMTETLRRATDQNTKNNKDSLSQLDARYRMDFAAKVIKRETGEPVDYMRNTGGKSGGEKEGFSGSIVAAALAYVLKPSGAPKPTYCTVFLDEAFANTSDTVAKRVLDVFNKLGLHLNLITPFKNVQLVRHVVQSAVVVTADAQSNSQLRDVTWEEIDQQLAAQNPSLAAQATRLGIRIAPADPDA